MKMTVMIVLGYLWGSAALATVKPEPLPEKQTQTQQQAQSQHQYQSQGQSQSARADSTSAAYAEANPNQLAQQTLTNVFERQVAALALGGMNIPDCATGLQAGGGDPSFNAVLGIMWRTEDCKIFTQARVWAALGAIDAACQAANMTPTAQKLAKRGLVLPAKCEVPVPPVAPPVVVNVDSSPTECPACPDCDKAFKQCVAK